MTRKSNPCLANGMLTKDDVSEAVYTAADCNYDGVIDQADIALLNEAGTLFANVKSILLVIAMLLSVAPITVFATEPAVCGEHTDADGNDFRDVYGDILNIKVLTTAYFI